jgi:hypothetical protein
MAFWTILIITYGSPLQGTVSYVAMPSQDACAEAMDLTYDLLISEMPDLMLQCQDTGIPTQQVRPMKRPAWIK